MTLDKLQERFEKRIKILEEKDIYLDSMLLCENTLQYYDLILSQIKLIENEKDLNTKWDLLDSAKNLIKTLDKRLARLIPNAEKEIEFWMNQTFDYSHKMLILANAEDLNFSLKLLTDRFEKQLENLSDEDVDTLEIENIYLRLSKAQVSLEKSIEWANKEAKKYYLNERITNKEQRKLFKKYVDFKRDLSYE